MSSSFVIETASTPTFEAVLTAMDGDDLRCMENPMADLRGEWPEGTLHFYRNRQSTRPIEILREGSEMQVRILSLSSPVGYNTAFQFVELLGGDGLAHNEEGEFRASEATTRFQGDWMTRNLATAIVSLVEAVRNDELGVYASLQGPVRPVYVGTRLLDRLSDDKGKIDPKALLEAVRCVQYLNEYEEISHLPWGIAGPNTTVAIWDLTRPSFFSGVTHVGVALSNTNAYLPVSVLPEVAGDRFRFLDDTQFIIAATPETERADVLQRAARLGVRAGGPKKWWQFWT